MTTGATNTDGPYLGIYPRWSVTRQWSGADKNSTYGLLWPHAYSMIGQRNHNGELVLLYNGNTYTVAEMLGLGNSASDPEWSGSDELKLLSKLTDKIRAHDFNAGVFIGTGAQTARLIGSSAFRIAQGLRSLKRGDGLGDIYDAMSTDKGGKIKPQRTLGDARKDLSQKWLEASYGWLPLVSDVYAAGEALSKHYNAERKMVFEVSHSVSSRVDEMDAISTTKSFSRRSVRLHYEAKSESELPSEWDALGLTNPGNILWELTPWSFVIDWFLPVGTFIELQTIIPRLTGSWWRTDRVVSTHERAPRSDEFIGKIPLMYRSTRITRGVGTGGISVPAPSFKSPFSQDWRRMANAIALLGSMGKR